MDYFKLGEDLAALTFWLVPLLVVAAAVAVTWWAIAHTRREKAQRQQRNQPPYPYIAADPRYHSQPFAAAPYGTTDRSGHPPRNEPVADQPHPQPSVSSAPGGFPLVPLAPPARKRPTVVVVIVVAGLVVVLAGAGAIVAVHAGLTPTTATTTGAIRRPEGSAVAIATPTLSPTPEPTTAAPSPTFTTVAAWYRGGGKALIDKIGADNAVLRAAPRRTDSVALRDACTQILADAWAAKSFAPIPDDQAQPLWAQSMPLIVQGALDCADTIDDTPDVTLLAKAIREMNDGFTGLNLVVARLNALLG